MKYTQITDAQVGQMLQAIEVNSVEELFAPVSQTLRLKKLLDLPKGVSETELLNDVGALAAKNRGCGRAICFLGAGAYDHFIPTVVDALAAQTEFLTAYTPYQAEASQGMLQLLFEFQSMISELTGMEVANASMYEVASAAAEAAMMAITITGRRQVVIAESVHHDTHRVVRTYARERDIEVSTIVTPDGVLDDALLQGVGEQTAAVILQSPNFFGCLERLDRLIPNIQQHGALAIIVTDPIASGIFKPPGAFGADIVVGEGQALGIPLQYGGPYLGLLAAKEKYLRKIPGRIVGQASDREGRRGFCLVLQTREQHIKRERATSNICTNQGLLAVRASIYLAAMGKQGIAEVASQCFDKAHYAAEQIARLDGYELRFQAPFFKEFVVKVRRGVKRALASCRERNILGGVPLTEFHQGLDDCFLVAVTEKRTKEEIDELIGALQAA